jgi:mRNA-degrading endonuclease toxin of MazEF toxin-antitoxin module
MTLNRGDIGMTRFPHAGGNRGKKRPVVIIQADVYNAKLNHFIVAEITRNLAAVSDPASFLIDVSTAEGKSDRPGPEFGGLLSVPRDCGRRPHY